MPHSQNKRPIILRVTVPIMWCLNNAVTSLNAAGTLLIFAMMALICADVIARNLLSSSLHGVIELTELGIVSIVFFANRGHVEIGEIDAL
jgi:TRAP-type C4-dicarboxylate transport system permease small subunit